VIFLCCGVNIISYDSILPSTYFFLNISYCFVLFVHSICKFVKNTFALLHIAVRYFQFFFQLSSSTTPYLGAPPEAARSSRWAVASLGRLATGGAACCPCPCGGAPPVEVGSTAEPTPVNSLQFPTRFSRLEYIDMCWSFATVVL
jgi:hypothetical protein